ncbi:hypothetical protein Ddc_04790 [Ditylenchus destructor]|nr:hypothetical protein Ddc_04790 [Ditylenchus destructor]
MPQVPEMCTQIPAHVIYRSYQQQQDYEGIEQIGVCTHFLRSFAPSLSGEQPSSMIFPKRRLHSVKSTLDLFFPSTVTIPAGDVN